MNAPLASRTTGATTAAGRGPWSTLRAEVRRRRLAQAERRQLRADLAAYDTPAAIDDLLAAVEASGSRHPEIVEILSDNRNAYYRRVELRHAV